jgi:hypothetical protein
VSNPFSGDQHAAHRRMQQGAQRQQAQQAFVNEQAQRSMRASLQRQVAQTEAIHRRAWRKARDDQLDWVQSRVRERQWQKRRRNPSVPLKEQSASEQRGSGGVGAMDGVWLAVLGAGLLLVLVVVGVAAASGSSRPLNTGGPYSVAGVTTSWAHVRAGPSTAYEITDTLQPGRALQIQCRTGTADDPWDLLASPYAGKYIGATLVRSARPPSCAKS